TMIKQLPEIRKYAGKPGLFILPFFCFTLVLFAKTELFLMTVGVPGSIKLYSQISGTVGALMVILSISLLLAPRFRLFYLIIIDVILSVIIFFDLIFFRYFQDVTTIRTFTVAWDYLTRETVWWKTLRITDLLLTADFLFLLGWWIFKRLFNQKSSKLNSKLNSKTDSPKAGKGFKYHWPLKLLMFVLIVLAGTGSCVRAYNVLEENQPGITKSFYSKTYIVQSIGEWEFRFLDIFRNLKTRLPEERKKSAITQREAVLAKWLRAEHPRSSETASTAKVPEGTNLIVIQLESFQEFVIGRSINGQEITPNLNRLLGQSLYFKNYFGETWSGGTSDAEFMSNVSLYPVSVGNAYIDYPGNDYVSLGKFLGERGYFTVAMEADQPGFWNMGLMFRSEGFQHILDMDDFVHDLDIGMGLADNSMFRQGADYLEKIPQPFYAFQVTLSSHYPFNIPDEYKSINVGPYQDSDFGKYLEAVHYTDQALGTYLERLRLDGLLDKSILAVYGDHQSPLARDNEELKRFLGYGDGSIDDYHWLALQKVPMLIRLPQEIESGIIETVGGHVDFFPTILGLIGEDAARYPFLGHDLLKQSGKGFAVNRSGLIVTNDAILDINQQKAYDFATGIPLPWEDFAQEQKRDQEYLQNTDLIMKYDLQQGLFRLLSAD
ncbi:MAG TPA: LTA synthase family protein, partial [Desulfitobacteriaceae bacterium]|nr:LTA synthase family protein [Desulfitobacteriaceae bacterium]